MANSDDETESGTPVEVPPPLGCDHYQRKCAFITPCCKKEYICRICHDNAELHSIDRKQVTQIKCLVCSKIQQIQENCEKCGIKFGQYYCAICRLFDDTDKGQFHCGPCGICRVGGQDKYYHCMTCDMCLALEMKGKHKCIEQATRANCPICMEDLHSSRIACHIPDCGHYLHKDCYKDMLKTGNYTCPLCNQSMVDMANVWEKMDEEIASTPMPDEYKNYHVYILCRDCHKESELVFHVIGLKCKECGSYNTCRSERPAKCPRNQENQSGSGESPADDMDHQSADSQASTSQESSSQESFHLSTSPNSAS